MANNENKGGEDPRADQPNSYLGHHTLYSDDHQFIIIIMMICTIDPRADQPNSYLGQHSLPHITHCTIILMKISRGLRTASHMRFEKEIGTRDYLRNWTGSEKKLCKKMWAKNLFDK